MLDELRAKKEEEARALLAKAGVEVSFPEIPFSADLIQKVEAIGGTVEYIPEGLTLAHLDRIGPLESQWWKKDPHFQDADPSEGKWVLWVPRVLGGSLGRTFEEQLQRAQGFWSEFGLNAELGKASELGYLILLRFHRTGVRFPDHLAWVRTTTPYQETETLALGHFSGIDGLRINHFGRDDRYFRLGIAPLGVIR